HGQRPDEQSVHLATLARSATMLAMRRRLAALAAAALVLAGCGGGGDGAAPAGGPKTSSGPSARPGGRPPARPAGILQVPGRPGPPRPVPILMYHVVADPPPGAPNPTLYVAGPDFAAHMRALAAAGYHGVSLEQVWKAWHEHGPLPARPVVVSFDDGYQSVYRNALPVMRRLGWPGVLNLELHITHTNFGLHAKRVRELIAAGWEVDSHTVRHLDLTTLPPSDLAAETAGARRAIRRRFGVPADFFCYPAGRFDATVIAAVRAAGYQAAMTTHPGWASPEADAAYRLNRVRVSGGTSPAGLVSEISGLKASAGPAPFFSGGAPRAPGGVASG
ncbi:MAG: polysaccharide deacetylase family protein, partial [Actinobacteria bacterium]|nr:polysaccharide deacetylase family protein [Actinomycetota bacterium]